MSSSQTNRGIAVTTQAGPDKLLFHRMSAFERLGCLFEFSLDLLSDDHNIVLEDLLGTPACVSVLLPNGSTRYFHGLVNRFSWAGSHSQKSVYRATLVPWLWFLTRTSNCRIFQNKTVPEIIETVFRDHGFTDYVLRFRETYRRWDYCVQYRESDFDFVSRLMEQEGIYYFFSHEDSKHEMVLADDASAHSAASGYATVPFFPPDEGRLREIEHVYHWSASNEVQTGAYVLDDYDFERPNADLLATSKSQRKHNLSKFEVYDYPGEYTKGQDGTNYSRRRIEEHEARFERVRGSANVLGFQTGSLFSLDGHFRSDQNAEYLIVATNLELTTSESETGQSDSESESELLPECSFEAIKSRQVFRSQRQTPSPKIRGPQTAVVVGKAGEEIFTDKYGRVKVQFHWDREGKSDENSSCWVRVAQSWAGKRWGSIHIPRVGQEVIVEFLEGDPDRPIITGRVYNANEMPPYKLPDNRTQSGIKTHSSSKGTDQNFNELRFEDKKGEEQVYFHAEKDFERIVENNDTLKVGFEKKDSGDQLIEIFNNQKVVIGDAKAKDGSQTIKILKNFTQTVSKGNATIAIEKGKRSTTIYDDDALTIKTGNRTTVVSQGDDSVSIKAGAHKTEAAKSILLKVGGSSIKIDQQGITIKAMKVSVQAQIKAEVKGTMVDAAASGVLTLKGAMAKIN
ncbi:Phage-related baseplate assembly protein [Stieleria maiorica]|uniref:Phage-related baseplate assembly protein n=1 Tax=Stieleria maiorica TaxID=2795974 RepID=A0A5B9MP39_9BACT|nr:type VI secretion system tip protein VgrG [Stieleria maiorica]QEG01406.1 Phage-related baseplate assembly protein [Stieleria maiorica]